MARVSTSRVQLQLLCQARKRVQKRQAAEDWVEMVEDAEAEAWVEEMDLVEAGGSEAADSEGVGG